MKRTAIVESFGVDTEGRPGFQIVDRFENKREAEKALGALPPGTYDIVTWAEVGIVVAEPAAPSKNVVQRGEKTVQRNREGTSA